MSQLENNTTDLQAVLDCVDELNVSASEAADKLEINTTDLQSILDAVNALPEASNTEIGVSYNADGTQNLIIKDDGSVIEIPDPNPVLLWTNASPTSNWSNQTIKLNGEDYDAYLLKLVGYKDYQNYYSIQYLPIDNTAHWLVALHYENSSYYGTTRQFTASNSSIVTASGALTQCIPVQIWGVKFTL